LCAAESRDPEKKWTIRFAIRLAEDRLAARHCADRAAPGLALVSVPIQ
jgi:hypothetical protein